MKMVFGILIIVAAVILIASLAPPYFSNYQFEDVLKTESQMSTYTTKTEDVIRDEVIRVLCGADRGTWELLKQCSELSSL